MIEYFGIDPLSHDGKAVLNVLETYPRDELFQASIDDLIRIARGVVNLYVRRTVRLLLEDLRELRMGDQIDGLSLDDGQRLMDLLGDLHATYWGKPVPGGVDWMVSLSDPMFGGMLTQLISSGLPARDVLRRRFMASVRGRS